MQEKNYSLTLGSQEFKVSLGKLAQQCNASCVLTVGETQVLSTCTISREPRDIDFLPLMVNYQEKYYAAGMIRGARFMRREARPPTDKVIMGRLIDRGIRPLLNKNMRHEMQVMLTVLSYDFINSHDMVAANAGSLSVALSEAPFDGPLGTVRVGMINGEFILNPTEEQRGESDLDLIVSSNMKSVVMLEIQANEVPEEKILEGIQFGFEAGQKISQFFADIAAECGREKFEIEAKELDSEVVAMVNEKFSEEVNQAIYHIDSKLARFGRIGELKKEAEEMAVEKFGEEDERVKDAANALDKLVKGTIRKNILEKEVRIAGRGLDEIRPLHCEVDLILRAHGSGLFQRGETQGLTVATLGSGSDTLLVDGMEGESEKRYFHHYNFPPYSVGEVSSRLSTGNRELGHGNLAEKALIPVMPTEEEFPYVVRTVTEILQSNGSSSMAATCGSTLSLMAAGVPIKAPVGGIAMGLMIDPDTGNFKILTDLQDEEDFGGDMDFKVTGTKKGVTALQMDIKVKGLSFEILKTGFEKAKLGRMKILDAMLAAIPEPRKELNKYAPRLYTLKIHPDDIKIVIGKGGETIQGIIKDTGVEIDIKDDGTVVIASKDADMANKAMDTIKRLTEKPEVGKIYEGEVVKIMDFGAFVRILPGTDGLVHISMLKNERVNRVEDVVKEGDVVKVKLMDIAQGKLRLSMKDVPTDS